ncbi:NTP transferase domain-containing protein [Salinisphaera aquimarina]|uniref:NTP transferase domain-containing protein n=1 Tax=Salinisphaera aquimarina TaxID=2094031 RepID=A0ABV7EII5_9GAMM
MTRTRAYAAIVLAGDRGPDDPIAAATGAPCKSLSPVGGIALLERVLETLRDTPRIGSIIVVGPARTMFADDSHAAAQLDTLLQMPGVQWVAPADSPSASAAGALALLEPDQPALLTTADHALLRPSMIAPLLAAEGNDLSVGMVEYAAVRAAYPHSRRTAIRLGRGDGYCSCNLFAIHTAAGRQLVSDWRRVERERKNPARVVAGMLGWMGVLRYALHRLTLADAFSRLSRRRRVNVSAVLLSEPEAAIDVDSLADLRLVESILATRLAAFAGNRPVDTT